MAKKPSNDVEALRVELYEMKQNGMLDNLSEQGFEQVSGRITSRINDYFKKVLQKQTAYFRTNFRKAFNYHRNKGLVDNHRGISRFTLDKLGPRFQNLYMTQNLSSIELIKSQNAENMNKLRNRFVGWITRAATTNKQELFEQTKIPRNDKKLRFILRDQTNKIASNMDHLVASEAKAIAMQWKTRQDNKVAGKPGGVNEVISNPKMHGNHWKRKDKFYWIPGKHEHLLNKSKFEGSTKDLKDGLPGQPIGCRCYAKYFYDVIELPKDLVAEEYR